MFSLVQFLFGKKEKTSIPIKKTYTENSPSESINVEKIVNVENDLDFLKNKLYFDFKNEGTIRRVELYKLLNYYKKHFQNDKEMIDLDSLENIKTLDLLALIIESDKGLEIKTCLLALEKRI